jgi:hypothetical protein
VCPPSFLRRLFQFRLRTLLLAVLALSLALGWYVRRVELQRQAVAAVRSAGGDVFYDYELSAGKLDFQKKSPVPQALLDRLGIDFFHAVVRVDVGPAFSNPNLQTMDAAIARLPDLPRLQHLVLADASDERLQAAGKLAQLERLAIFDERGRVTSDGIEELRHLPRLKHLWIEGVRGLSDETLRVVSALPDLEVVSMIGPIAPGSAPPDFTDSGLVHLERLQNLKVLRLEGCDERQFSRLRKARPDCEIGPWCLLDTGTE